jgi:Cdc6-like AAA superfamily ATPase
MNLLLTAVFVSCNADTPSQRDKLTARKDCLINKLSDNAPEVVSLLIKIYGPTGRGKHNMSSTGETAKLKSLVRKALMASCGVLESQDATTIAKDLAQSVPTNGDKFSVRQDQLLPDIQQCIDA